MHDVEFELMARQEADHWWYEARRNLLRNALQNNAASKPDCRILDLASACGGNLPVCGDFGYTVGIDMSELAIGYCQGRSKTGLVRGDVQVLPFAEASFDVVVAFDIFEHLPRDTDSMDDVFRVLKPGGALLVNVPACQALFSAHDEAFAHYRRYSKDQLRTRLRDAGFAVEFLSHWSFFIFPLVFAARKLLRRSGVTAHQATSDFHRNVPSPVDWTLGFLSRVEIKTLQRNKGFPWGVSLYGIFRKPAAEVGHSSLGIGLADVPSPKER